MFNRNLYSKHIYILGMYLWTINKNWNITINPRLLTTHDNSTEKNKLEFYKKFLVENVGNDYGGQLFFESLHFRVEIFSKKIVCKKQTGFLALLIAFPFSSSNALHSQHVCDFVAETRSKISNFLLLFNGFCLSLPIYDVHFHFFGS